MNREVVIENPEAENIYVSLSKEDGVPFLEISSGVMALCIGTDSGLTVEKVREIGEAFLSFADEFERRQALNKFIVDIKED